MAKATFQKFIDKSIKGARLKEQIRQEKKKQRQETKEYFEEKKKAARAARGTAYQERNQEQAGGKRPGGDTKFSSKKNQSTNPQREFSSDTRKSFGSDKKKAYSSNTRKDSASSPGKEFTPTTRKENTQGRKAIIPVTKSAQAKAAEPKKTVAAEQMPLNKFISHAGICSRRDAAELVRTGKITVNGNLVSEPGFKVSEKDEVKYNGKRILPARNQVYILLNKPKDYITTMEDPEGRKTVYDIIRLATQERVYPVGRLDRNTTGVLLFTNDGELAQKLSHPSYQVRKIYEVKLDKPLIKKDFETILSGVTLEDGKITPDSLAYADSKDKSVIGIEIHSGRNRIVRRIFESLGYDVKNLDRVMYANLTKKNVERGKFRYLSEKEVRLLKFMNASYAKKKENRKA